MGAAAFIAPRLGAMTNKTKSDAAVRSKILFRRLDLTIGHVVDNRVDHNAYTGFAAPPHHVSEFLRSTPSALQFVRYRLVAHVPLRAFYVFRDRRDLNVLEAG